MITKQIKMKDSDSYRHRIGTVNLAPDTMTESVTLQNYITTVMPHLLRITINALLTLQLGHTEKAGRDCLRHRTMMNCEITCLGKLWHPLDGLFWVHDYLLISNIVDFLPTKTWRCSHFLILTTIINSGIALFSDNDIYTIYPSLFTGYITEKTQTILS